MKNFFLPFAKLATVAACALTLGSCNRAEYAMLPKSASYHGVTRVATPVPAKASTEEQVAVEAQDAVKEPAIVAAAPTTKSVAAAPVQPAATATEPQAAAAPSAPEVTTSAATATTPTLKMNVVQRLALNKVTKKVDKLVQRAIASKHSNTASTSETSAVSGNLRLGIILMVIGALLALLPGLFRLLGLIVFIIGALFVILWLLDQA